MALTFTLVWFAAAAGADTLRIGVLDYSGADHPLTDWTPTMEALDAGLPGFDVELVALDIHALEAAVAAGTLDFLITNPGNYAELEYRYHISRIATADENLPVASTLVAVDPAPAGLADLAGKRLAVVATEAFGGFQAMWRELAEANPGLPGRIDWVVTGYPMQSAAQAVLDGRADAAVLRACLLEELQAAEPEVYGRLVSFEARSDPESGCAVSSRTYPGWPFAKMAQTPPDLAKQVAVVLLQMQDGNVWTVPVDYQPVHDLLRALKIGPYARTGPVSLSEFFEDYREWLFGIAAALAFWAIHSVRTETLVRRRTRALDQANAGLKHEIAERHRIEEEERQHRRELEHVARLSILGEMASSIAHELNQPLSAISTYAQGCLMRLKAGRLDPGDMARASEEIAAQADRAALVIKRIRAFVRKREIQRTPVDLSEMVQDCAALFEATTHRAGVRVEMLLAPDLPTVQADRVHLQQVVLNLVQNAVDAMAAIPPAERRLLIRTAVEVDPLRGEGLCLSVRDRGCGMNDAALDRFAEAFHTTKPEGIGLGLALSRSIVEAHGGSLRAERPQDGQGLRVTLWLPIGEEA
ncbi:PhnD/SsuA/transferrin family substrate-binding protein [Tropicimonas sp. IMCC34043]|uniref:sensor histidine kinase n=1 Tax=Tropicimonas sp. IMCC34043 TaxID=2248760 RepID=UPI0018E53314|nr:PhnD/SsuA/transferrin family substrate-binding protein [Tropicimonas sp. IMCC34043]